jgi:LPXTG-site transpeptidase (sortase) family protein
MILTMLPVAAMELKYQLDVNRQSLNVNREKSAVSDSRLAVSEPPAGPANDMEAFAIHISKINAHSVVVPNVDANDPKIYMEALKNGVAHALGSGLPGVESSINRSIYLFAHSTSAPSLVSQYNAQFYLLYKLEVGDEVDVTFWAKNYRYKIVEKKTVSADDTSFLQPQTDKELLILATCTPPGTTWKRLIVVAERIAE